VRAVVYMSREWTRVWRARGRHGCVRISSADGVAGCARDWRIDVRFATPVRIRSSCLRSMCIRCVLLVDVHV